MTNRRKPLDESWQSFVRIVLKNAELSQLVECRQAFFAGGAIVHQALMRLLEPGTEPTANDEQLFRMVLKELRFFAHNAEAPPDPHSFIGRGWCAYRDLYPAGFSPLMMNELRKSFYSGVGGMFRIVNSANNAAADAAVTILNDLHMELTEFAQSVDRRFCIHHQWGHA